MISTITILFGTGITLALVAILKVMLSFREENVVFEIDIRAKRKKKSF